MVLSSTDLDLVPFDRREDIVRDLSLEPRSSQKGTRVIVLKLTKKDIALSKLTDQGVKAAVLQELTPVQKIVVRSILFERKSPKMVAQELGAVDHIKVTPQDVALAFRCAFGIAQSALLASA